MAPANTLLVPFLAAAFALAGCSMKRTAAAEGGTPAWGNESEGLRCCVRPDGNRWRRGSPAIVGVVIQNRSGKKVEFQTVPSFDLGDEYWCPVALTTEGRPLEANARSKLSLEKGASLELQFDLSQLGWDESASSAWPEENFYELVPPGAYKLRLDVQLSADEHPKRLRSNEVEVRILK
jgi:hypothetical protein